MHIMKHHINQIIAGCHKLDTKQRQQLQSIIEELKELFGGTLGSWKDKQLKIEIKEGIQLYHAKGYSIPRSRKQT